MKWLCQSWFNFWQQAWRLVQLQNVQGSSQHGKQESRIRAWEGEVKVEHFERLKYFWLKVLFAECCVCVSTLAPLTLTSHGPITRACPRTSCSPPSSPWWRWWRSLTGWAWRTRAGSLPGTARTFSSSDKWYSVKSWSDGENTGLLNFYTELKVARGRVTILSAPCTPSSWVSPHHPPRCFLTRVLRVWWRVLTPRCSCSQFSESLEAVGRPRYPPRLGCQ